MTVSGLGSARTTHTPLTPARRTTRVEKPAERNDFDSLTAADRELIFQVTGQRVGPGFDRGQGTTAFAVALASERAVGHLAPGQEITAVYLKDLSHRYERARRPNPLAGHLDKAVDFLSRTGSRRIDVSA